MKEALAALVLVTAFLQALCQRHNSPNWEEIRKKCQEEWPLSTDSIINNKWTNEEMCYVNCVLEESKFVTNGTVNYDEVKYYVQDLTDENTLAKLVKFFSTCYDNHAGKKSENKCEVSFAAYQCGWDTVEKIYWLLVIQ